MAYALLANRGEALGANGGTTTAGIDTTGADLIVVCITIYGPGGWVNVTDNSSGANTYTNLTDYGTATFKVRISYCAAPAWTSASHTWTFSQTGTYSTISVMVFSGSAASPADQANGNSSGVAVETLSTNPITPTQNNELLVAAAVLNDSATAFSISGGGFSGLEHSILKGANNVALASAYTVQTTAAESNPSFSWTTLGEVGTTIASFKAAGTFIPAKIVIAPAGFA